MTHEEKLFPIPGGDGPVWWERRSEDDGASHPAREAGDRHRFASAALIVDTRSRIGEPAFRVARDILAASGVPLRSAYALGDPARLPGAVRGAISEGHDLIVVGGGDAAIGSVVGLLAGSGAVLGLLPLGAANDLARSLGIPLGLEGACETVARGRVVDASLGLAGDECFANEATVGLGAGATRALRPRLGRTGATPAYPPRADMKAFLEQQPFSAALDFPDGDHDSVFLDRLVQVAVAAGRFRGASRTDPVDGDGALDVYAVEAGRGTGLGQLVRAVGDGEFVRGGCLHRWRTSRVRIETAPRLPIALDGESIARTPRPFSVAPDGLKVLVPTLPASLPPSGAPRTRDLARYR